jgi:hypothetical protein
LTGADDVRERLAGRESGQLGGDEPIRPRREGRARAADVR